MTVLLFYTLHTCESTQAGFVKRSSTRSRILGHPTTTPSRLHLRKSPGRFLFGAIPFGGPNPSVFFMLSFCVYVFFSVFHGGSLYRFCNELILSLVLFYSFCLTLRDFPHDLTLIEQFGALAGSPIQYQQVCCCLKILCIPSVSLPSTLPSVSFSLLASRLSQCRCGFSKCC